MVKLLVTNKFSSYRKFEKHALHEIVGREFSLNNLSDDGEVGKLAEIKLFGKVASAGETDFYVRGKSNELKVYKGDSIHILTSKSEFRIRERAFKKMQRTHLIYYKKIGDKVIYDTLYRLKKINKDKFKELIKVKKNKYDQYEVRITIKNIEQSYIITEVAWGLTLTLK